MSVYLLVALLAYVFFIGVLVVSGAPMETLERAVIFAAFFIGILFFVFFDGMVRGDRGEGGIEIIELATIAPVFEDADHGVVALDIHRTIVSVNRAAEKILGADRGKLLGSHMGAHFEIRSSRTSQPHVSFIDAAFQRGIISCTEEETYILLRSRREIPVYMSATPLLRENKKTGAVLLAVHDLTAENQIRTPQRKMQKKLKTEFVDNGGTTRG